MLQLTDFIEKKIKSPGVLAFQGDFAEHMEWLNAQGYDPRKVRSIQDLEKVDYLSIPGGESTVIGRFLESTGVGDAIKRRVEEDSNFYIYGTCAGAILLAKEIISPVPVYSLGLLDIKIERNAYGSQLDSFDQELEFHDTTNKFKASFIRAPKFKSVSNENEIIVKYQRSPVMIRKDNIFASTFHPEVFVKSSNLVTA